MSRNTYIFITTLLLLGLFAMKVSSIQYSKEGDRMYTKKDCTEDLQFIADKITNTHPAPFEYISENDFNFILQTQILALDEENTLRDFHWIARKLIATIGCGHTSLNGQNEEREIADSLHFPLNTRFVKDRLIVVENDSRHPTIKIGNEIKQINGQSVPSMLHSMIQRVSSDGLNDAYPRFYINREVNFFIESYFNIPEYYNITLNDGSAKVISASTLNQDVYTQDGPIDNLLFEIDENRDLAIMTIKSFNYYRSEYDKFEKFVDQSMSQLHTLGLKNLIIDIRGNGGGDPNCANHLLRYIARSPYQYFANSNVGYPKLKTEISPYDHSFKGTTYMIIDGGCGSTSGHLSSLVKYNQSAILVGQTSGATFKCHDNSENITLPNTRLNLHIARNTFETAVQGMKMSEGVVPDIVIHKDLKDWSTDHDSVIDSIYQLIR